MSLNGAEKSHAHSSYGVLRYFIICTQQTLQPGERIEMPVRFIVDRNMPKEVKHLTLAYTLFDITAAR